MNAVRLHQHSEILTVLDTVVVSLVVRPRNSHKVVAGLESSF
jgi:hypothetical protein